MTKKRKPSYTDEFSLNVTFIEQRRNSHTKNGDTVEKRVEAYDPDSTQEGGETNERNETTY